MTSPAPDEAARARLDRHMDARRAELHMRWKDVAEKAGLTTEGLRGVRSGTGEIRSLTKSGIERALSWAPGSIDAVLDGGEPTTTVYGSATIGGGQLKMTARGTASFDPPEESEDDDPKMQRAEELLAEAAALIAEIRRERREGA